MKLNTQKLYFVSVSSYISTVKAVLYGHSFGWQPVIYSQIAMEFSVAVNDRIDCMSDGDDAKTLQTDHFSSGSLKSGAKQ